MSRKAEFFFSAWLSALLRRGPFPPVLRPRGCLLSALHWLLLHLEGPGVRALLGRGSASTGSLPSRSQPCTSLHPAGGPLGRRKLPLQGQSRRPVQRGLLTACAARAGSPRGAVTVCPAESTLKQMEYSNSAAPHVSTCLITWYTVSAGLFQLDTNQVQRYT